MQWRLFPLWASVVRAPRPRAASIKTRLSLIDIPLLFDRISFSHFKSLIFFLFLTKKSSFNASCPWSWRMLHRAVEAAFFHYHCNFTEFIFLLWISNCVLFLTRNSGSIVCLRLLPLVGFRECLTERLFWGCWGCFLSLPLIICCDTGIDKDKSKYQNSDKPTILPKHSFHFFQIEFILI